LVQFPSIETIGLLSQRNFHFYSVSISNEPNESKTSVIFGVIPLAVLLTVIVFICVPIIMKKTNDDEKDPEQYMTITGFEWHPRSSDHILYSSTNKKIKLSNIQTGQAEKVLSHHTDKVNCFVISADAKTIRLRNFFLHLRKN
jgi:WD40 repeat protein